MCQLPEVREGEGCLLGLAGNWLEVERVVVDTIVEQQHPLREPTALPEASHAACRTEQPVKKNIFLSLPSNRVVAVTVYKVTDVLSRK